MKIFGILAHPAGHSLSPAMHNAAFSKLNIKANFKFFDIKEKDLKKFFSQVKTEKITGLAVSIPYKEKIFPFLDQIDDVVRSTGSINTVFWKNNKLCGSNTDVFGFSKALQEKYQVAKKNVLIFGAGGSARSVIFSLKTLKAKKIFLWARKIEQSKKLAQNFKINFLPSSLDEIDFQQFDLVINTTPLGMWPQENNCVLPKKFWKKFSAAFDLVMNPQKTKFLQYAQEINAKTIFGYKMLLYQGMRQFEIWHQRKAPLKLMEEVLLEKLKQDS